MSPEERFAAKRINESVRMTATFLNNLAVGTVIAGFLSPLASGRSIPVWADATLFAVATVLHVTARATLEKLLQRED